MKGLPLTYNSDMQEDKEPFFDTVDTLEAMLARAAAHAREPDLPGRPHARGRGRASTPRPRTSPTTSCARACRSARPTRSWGAPSATASREGKELGELSLEELRRFSPLIEKRRHAALTVEASLRARAVTGGTAPEAVARALAQARGRIAQGPQR